MFAATHCYELYSHWWDWFLVPVVSIYLIYLITHWLPEELLAHFKTIGPLYTGCLLLLCLVVTAEAIIMGWRCGYYNTPQNTPYETHTGGIWTDEHGQWHFTPPKYTYYDENTNRRIVGGEFAILGGVISICLFVVLEHLIYLIISNRGKIKTWRTNRKADKQKIK